MKSDFIIDSLEFLEDKLIVEAGKKRVDRRKIIYLRTSIAAAACLAVVIMAGVIMGQQPGRSNGTNIKVADNEKKSFRLGRDSFFDAPDNPSASHEPKDSILALETDVPETQYSPGVLDTERPGETGNPVTERPDADLTTKTPGPTESVTNTPDVHETVMPTEIITEVPMQEWTSHLAVTDTEVGEGYYGVDETFVMTWFGSALNIEYIEPTPTPMPTPVPTIIPTPTPTPVPTITPIPTPTPVPTDIPTQLPSEDPPFPPTETPGGPIIESDPPADLPSLPELTPPPPEEVPTAPKPPPTDNSDVSSGWNYAMEIGTKYYQWQKRMVPLTYIDGSAGTAVMKGVNHKKVEKTTQVSLYQIKGVSSEAAVAVKVSGHNEYYLFCNENFVPITFKEYINAYNLRTYLKWDSMALYSKSETDLNISSSEVWNVLSISDGKTVSAEYVYRNCKLALAIGMDIDLYGYQDIPMAVFEEGYVMISLFNQTYAFNVGRATVDNIKALMK